MRPSRLLLALAGACAAGGAPVLKPAPAPGAEKIGRIVSVLELRSKLQPGDAQKLDAGYVADRLRAEVLGSGIDASVVSRENMLVLLQAQGRPLADCEGDCEVETGRRIGADFVVSGELLRVGEGLRASLRLHETRGGALLGAATAAGNTPEELDQSLAAAVRSLTAPLRPSAPGQTARGPASFDARAFVAQQQSALECEGAARRLRDGAPDQAWAALVACVEHTGWPRSEFTFLERITAGFWDAELAARPDAPALIARIIALRGGDVEGDLPLVQRSRVPLFTLAAALREPRVYQGRWLLIRGALTGMREDSGRPAALMRETSLRSASREVVGPVSRIDHSRTTAIRGEVDSARSGSARGEWQVKSSARHELSTVQQRYDNERVETGRRAIGRMAQADPFLEPDRDFLFLARFDGVAQDPQPVAMLSIARYFRPSSLLIQ